MSGSYLQEPLLLDLRHHGKQVPELGISCFVEPLENFCTLFHFKIDLRLFTVRHPERVCHFMLEQVGAALPRPDESVRDRFPGEHLDKGESLGLRVETYQFVAADHPPYQLAVRSFDSALDNHQVEVIHVRLGDIDRVPAETLDMFFHPCSMERTHDRVTGLHGTERDASFAPPAFTHQDLVGPLAQGCLEQVEHGHFSASRRTTRPLSFALCQRHFPYPVPVR